MLVGVPRTKYHHAGSGRRGGPPRVSIPTCEYIHRVPHLERHIQHWWDRCHSRVARLALLGGGGGGGAQQLGRDAARRPSPDAKRLLLLSLLAAYAEDKAAWASASRLSEGCLGCLQRQSMHRAAPSSGQPRPISRLGRLGRAGLTEHAGLGLDRARRRRPPRCRARGRRRPSGCRARRSRASTAAPGQAGRRHTDGVAGWQRPHLSLFTIE